MDKLVNRRSERGSAIVETALFMPIILLLGFGTIELGLGIHQRDVLYAATDDAVQYGVEAVTPKKTAAQVQARVAAYLAQAGFSTPAPTVSVVGANGSQGSYLTVSIQQDMRQMVLVRLLGASSAFRLNAQSVGVIE